ncbi:hypothetical protein [uncultured Azohydromonas sp.]|mgnify:CR=1 FL=1|jgi:hypothetical protein|uniref:hypothetical protein n=1 Tax=uncultured Azohydromonas sp. TaxID=487342 RepID=UPI0026377286|nr:hypothetical protein [uncultured Azohydromonas sp.]
MSSKPARSRIDASGLRYVSKAHGTPFGERHADSTRTMSCFLCGVHQPRAQLRSRKFVGRVQYVCAPSCRERREQAMQPAQALVKSDDGA